MVIAEVSVVPVGTKTPSVSEYVTKAVKRLSQEKGIKYQVMATGTVVAGELVDVLEAVKNMHECLFGEEVKRVITTLRIDDRRDKELTIGYEVESVVKRLG